MIDHITIRVQDIERTKLFYSKALAPLGYEIGFNQTFGAVTVIGLGINKKLDTWFTTDRPVSGPTHIAWVADTSSVVDAFYKSAIEAGGKDNGKPGLRPEYHDNYYAAFVVDPDGNNIEVVCRNA
jgi:catechol 2,3-dioxygenase-like lactoylglutathione lyase family enzyme